MIPTTMAEAWTMLMDRRRDDLRVESPAGDALGVEVESVGMCVRQARERYFRVYARADSTMLNRQQIGNLEGTKRFNVAQSGYEPSCAVTKVLSASHEKVIDVRRSQARDCSVELSVPCAQVRDFCGVNACIAATGVCFGMSRAW